MAGATIPLTMNVPAPARIRGSSRRTETVPRPVSAKVGKPPATDFVAVTTKRVEGSYAHAVTPAPRYPKNVSLGERHFRRALKEFVDHYHRERNHQGLENRLIEGDPPRRRAGRIGRRQRLGQFLASVVPSPQLRGNGGHRRPSSDRPSAPATLSFLTSHRPPRGSPCQSNP